MVIGLLGNESPDSNRFTPVTPKSENDVRLQATLGNQNPTGLPVGAVSAIIVKLCQKLSAALKSCMNILVAILQAHVKLQKVSAILMHRRYHMFAVRVLASADRRALLIFLKKYNNKKVRKIPLASGGAYKKSRRIYLVFNLINNYLPATPSDKCRLGIGQIFFVQNYIGIFTHNLHI